MQTTAGPPPQTPVSSPPACHRRPANRTVLLTRNSRGGQILRSERRRIVGPGGPPIPKAVPGSVHGAYGSGAISRSGGKVSVSRREQRVGRVVLLIPSAVLLTLHCAVADGL